MEPLLVVLLSGAFTVSAVLTGLIRAHAPSLGLIDVPNERSSHTIPKPRGGGLAFVAAFLLGMAALLALDTISLRLFAAVAGSGLLVAAVGWIDDRKGLPASRRALVHGAAAVWALAWLGGVPPLDLGFTTLAWGGIGQVVGVIGIVWLINLYNFMDGIDGLAGSEAVAVGIGAGLLLLGRGEGALASVAGLIAAACLGFLFWNWPPARIFMGDVGSGFLGMVFAALAIASMQQQAMLLWQWMILLGVFVTDTTFTLLRRVARGARWHEAHRSHAFQKAAQRAGRHLPVTTGALGITILWLFPWAFLAGSVPRFALPILAVALLPLVAAAACLRAGIDTK